VQSILPMLYSDGAHVLIECFGFNWFILKGPGCELVSCTPRGPLRCWNSWPSRFDPHIVLFVVYLSFVVLTPVHIPCRCGGYLLSFIALGDASALGRTPLDGWWLRRRDVYLTTHSTYKRPMSPAGFDLTVPASERPQTTSYTARPLGSAMVCLYG
jgi:hypothetical protein